MTPETRRALQGSLILHGFMLAFLGLTLHFEDKIIRTNPVDLSLPMQASLVLESGQKAPAQKVVKIPKVIETIKLVENDKKATFAVKKTKEKKQEAPKKEKEVVKIEKKVALVKKPLVDQKALQAEIERSLQNELASEQSSLQVADEIAQYHQIIVAHIQQYWRQPLDPESSLSCLIQVRVLATGEVASATVVRGSGNVGFDHAATLAVLRASPLPLPSAAEARAPFLKGFHFLFKPEAL